MEVDDILDFVIRFWHVGPMGMPGNAHKVQSLLRVVQRVLKRSVRVRDTTVVVDVTKESPKVVVTIHSAASYAMISVFARLS